MRSANDDERRDEGERQAARHRAGGYLKRDCETVCRSPGSELR
jgi:hypothetical protein